MAVVLDAYAIVALLVGERAGRDVQPLISGGLLCAPNAAEVLDVCVRVHKNETDVVRERLRWLTSGGLDVPPLDSGLGLMAGALRARHYKKRACEVSLGDCCALALAKARGLPLATADPGLATAARAEDVKVVALPDSRGERP